jgi:starch-binding outer membrane protein, SusD/RagB family
MKFKITLLSVLAGLLLFTSCNEEWLTETPSSTVTKETFEKLATQDPEKLNSMVLGIYSFMVQSNVMKAESGAHDDFSYMSVLHSTDLMTEDMVQVLSHWFTYDYQLDNRIWNYRRTNVNWRTFYTLISKANAIIENIPDDVASEGGKAILGQAYAIRGMGYYYLIQLYQKGYANKAENLNLPGVPIYIAPRQGENRIGRNTVKDVFDVIESDLLQATSLLEGWSRPAKYYVDATVVKGLLARYYLMAYDYPNAEKWAKDARSGYPIMSADETLKGFMDIENVEWMWGADLTSETQTTYASFFSHISTVSPGYCGAIGAFRAIDANLYAQIGPDDIRKQHFLAAAAGNYPKFANMKFGWKDGWLQDYLFMRASEMVLIEAEALAGQGKNAEAANVLKVLMEKRDATWAATSVTVEDVFLQRRIELWGEGFGYFDRKRLGKGVTRVYDGSNHRPGALTYRNVPAESPLWVYQIPQAEIQENTEITEDQKND